MEELLKNNVMQTTGRISDVITGKAANNPQPAALTPPQAAKVIADIRLPRGVANSTLHHKPQTDKMRLPKPAVALKPAPAKHRVHHIHAHPTQTAQTLMRRSVQKPAMLQMPRLKVRAPVDSTFALMRHKHTVGKTATLDIARQKRAAAIPKSAAVQRFRQVIPAAGFETAPDRPVAARPEPGPVASAPNGYHKHIEHALVTAQSHKQTVPKDSRRSVRFSNRFVAVTVAIVAAVVIGGFLLTQSLPQIDVSLASMHAGFQANLPSYQPAGFAFMSHVEAQPGNVTISYQSVTDSRHFSVTQQTTNWNDATLKAYIASTGLTARSWQDQGHTLYLYGNHLSWLANGIWYQITNQARLSSAQLLNIAASM